MKPRNATTYLAELERAVVFSRELGLTQRTGFDRGPSILSDEFCAILNEWMRINICPRPDDQIAGRCLRISLELLTFLAGADIPAVYTLGWMTHHGEALFKFGEADVVAWLESGLPDRNRLDMHAWITLGSGEVIDPTWLSTFGIVRNRRDLVGTLIVTDHDPESPHRYHPVVVDTAIVERLNLLSLVQDVMQYLGDGVCA